jgi:hypothetical protein
MDSSEMGNIEDSFLPGVSAQKCMAALAKAGGNELGSGKLLSPESSSALAVNAFGWFYDRPALLPAFPGLEDLDWPAMKVEVERQMRFPWSGGRHPWLDAAVETVSSLVGVESKRFEPFRDTKTGTLSPAYDRDVWGNGMQPFLEMRDLLRQEKAFAFLDAVQLVKHAFGLITEGRRLGKKPILLYLFAEPAALAGRVIPQASFEAHRDEIARFSRFVEGADVRFAACSYREWTAGWTGAAATHRLALLNRFEP